MPGLFFSDYDVSADGQSFVMFTGGGEEVGTTTLNLVTGWFTELRSLSRSDES